MANQVTDELRDFHRFLGAKLSDGSVACTPEEVVDEWRQLHPDPQAADDDVAAIQQALIDLANGDRGIPFAEFDREFRKRHNLPDRP